MVTLTNYDTGQQPNKETAPPLRFEVSVTLYSGKNQNADASGEVSVVRLR